jgi:hypothetical protein
VILYPVVIASLVSLPRVVSMKTVLLVLVYLIIVSTCAALMGSSRAIVGSKRITLSPGRSSLLKAEGSDGSNPLNYWYNPDFPQRQLKEWFLEAEKPLVRVGGKGISDTHVTSLNELLGHHSYVRVKVSSAKFGPKQLSAEFTHSSLLRSDAKLLMLTQREILFGVVGA